MQAFGSPILVEWGHRAERGLVFLEWKMEWRRKGRAAALRRAYRHIVGLMRGEGAENLQWIWHVNWFDQPETK